MSGFSKSIFTKYSRPGGRYSFSPATKSWNCADIRAKIETQKQIINSMFSATKVGIYIHLPFCPRLCTFCGCNIRVSQNNEELKLYLSALSKQLDLYLNHVNSQTLEQKSLECIYFGGGTPNVFSPEQLGQFTQQVLQKMADKNISPSQDFEITLEADPRLDVKDHLDQLSLFGKTKISIGIQDLNTKVTNNINRIQRPEHILKTIEEINKNYELHADLVYGLAHQDKDSFVSGLKEVISTKICGISLYPLVPVPWQQKAQKAFGENSNIDAEKKAEIYFASAELLKNESYFQLGFGHYTKKESKLFQSFSNQTLFRSPMGYHKSLHYTLIPLGVSSIGKTDYKSSEQSWLVQSEKVYEKYMHSVLALEEVPFIRAHELEIRDKIQNEVNILISTRNEIDKQTLKNLEDIDQTPTDQRVKGLIIDGLLSFDTTNSSVIITELGRHFLKDICHSFQIQSIL